MVDEGAEQMGWWGSREPGDVWESLWLGLARADRGTGDLKSILSKALWSARRVHGDIRGRVPMKLDGVRILLIEKMTSHYVGHEKRLYGMVDRLLTLFSKTDPDSLKNQEEISTAFLHALQRSAEIHQEAVEEFTRNNEDQADDEAFVATSEKKSLDHVWESFAKKVREAAAR